MQVNTNEIDNYLLNKMSEEQKSNFEGRIRTDKELARQVKVHKLELRTAELLQEDKLRAKMNRWEAERGEVEVEMPAEAKVVQMSSRARIIRFAVAASVLLLVGMFSLTVIGGGQSSDVLAMQSFEKTASTDKSNSPTTFPEVLQPGLIAMQSGDYEKAIKYFEGVQSPAYDELVKMYIAESYYRTNEYAKAGNVYQDLAVSAQNPINQQKAEWYLILTRYTADKNDVTANQLLSEIVANPEHSYHSHAVKFEKETASFWQRLFK